MEWKKASLELGATLEAAMKDFDCRKKNMFGAPVYVVNGNMFTGVHQDNIFLRLSEADRREVIQKYKGVAPFEPLKGRVMKEYVVIPEEIYRNPALLREWLKRGYDFAGSLAPKPPKGRSRVGIVLT